jgi:hypothetical protein
VRSPPEAFHRIAVRTMHVFPAGTVNTGTYALAIVDVNFARLWL